MDSCAKREGPGRLKVSWYENRISKDHCVRYGTDPKEFRVQIFARGLMHVTRLGAKFVQWNVRYKNDK